MHYKLSLALLFCVFCLVLCNGSIIQIKSKNGDIFDCIDIHLQPAFQNPLLEDHEIQMKPSSYPTFTTEDDVGTIYSTSPIERVPCPNGSVPIWRNPVQNHTNSLLTRRSWYQINNNRSSEIKNNKSDKETVYSAYYGLDGAFRGTKATITVYEPDVEVEGNVDRLSAASAFLAYFEGHDQKEMLDAGWAVWPKISGDKHVRFFISMVGLPVYTSCVNGCVNLQHGSFVQVSSDIPLGLQLPVSSYGGQQVAITVHIFKDPESGNWWVALGDAKTVIGYWPELLLFYLNVDATRVGWGGQIAIEKQPSPAMGSGHFPSEGYGKAAMFSKTMIVDGKYNLTVPELFKSKNGVATNPECYGISKFTTAKDGISFFFGGPAGCKS